MALAFDTTTATSLNSATDTDDWCRRLGNAIGITFTGTNTTADTPPKSCVVKVTKTAIVGGAVTNIRSCTLTTTAGLNWTIVSNALSIKGQLTVDSVEAAADIDDTANFTYKLRFEKTAVSTTFFEGILTRSSGSGDFTIPTADFSTTDFTSTTNGTTPNNGLSFYSTLKIVPPANLNKPAATTRNKLLQPFDKYSIWNVPIGSSAVYAPTATTQGETLGNPNAHGGQNGDWATMPIVDEDIIVVCTMSASNPPTSVTSVSGLAYTRRVVYSPGGWGGDRCQKNDINFQGLPLSNAKIPNDFIVPSQGGNTSAAILQSDGNTFQQCQPFARCPDTVGGTTATGDATAWVSSSNWTTTLTSRGELGSHGGSGLSAIGGTIRIHELRPNQQGPAHALKVLVYAREFLCSTAPFYTWPAVTNDSYANGWYGTNGGGNATDIDGVASTFNGAQGYNSNGNMMMGALLAIHPSVTYQSIGIQTEPGRQLFWTLQNYGAYIVDDTYGNGFGICVENGPSGSVVANLKNDYSIDNGLRVRDQRLNASTINQQWVSDIRALANALQVITNNLASTNASNGPAGGGSPRVPFSPDPT